MHNGLKTLFELVEKSGRRQFETESFKYHMYSYVDRDPFFGLCEKWITVFEITEKEVRVQVVKFLRFRFESKQQRAWSITRNDGTYSMPSQLDFDTFLKLQKELNWLLRE